ncbi:GST-like protein [Sphingobium sp. SCG-1]|uniref:MAPEG family protein n=1 Tax=Sphingobium sp. SCG-1 TaxID=2072936 RepID=UPI000CD678B5|nr:MAPEG family protein [Sphingobium sp. SCG-1]AUW59244.1 GST-like protein [Sphingobium sp. SCG-1]
MFLPITLTFAAAAALLNFWLAMRVSRLRMSEKVLHGDGGSATLTKRMRAQANYVEYTPFILILTALIEMAWNSPTWLWVLSLIYIVARIAHAFGMDADHPAKTRMFGIIVTWMVVLTLSGAALYTVYAGTEEGTPADTTSATV